MHLVVQSYPDDYRHRHYRAENLQPSQHLLLSLVVYKYCLCDFDFVSAQGIFVVEGVSDVIGWNHLADEAFVPVRPGLTVMNLSIVVFEPHQSREIGGHFERTWFRGDLVV